MNENLAHGLTFKTHWENQETQEWEEPSDGSSDPKMHEARRWCEKCQTADGAEK